MTLNNLIICRKDSLPLFKDVENTFISTDFLIVRSQLLKQHKQTTEEVLNLNQNSKIIIEPPHTTNLKFTWEHVLHFLTEKYSIPILNYLLIISKNTNTKTRHTNQITNPFGWIDTMYEAFKSGVSYTLIESTSQIIETTNKHLNSTSHYQNEVQNPIIT
jgi:hypothetical protein